MIPIKTPQEIELMKESGRIAASILREVKDRVAPGVTTRELNDFAEKRIMEHGVEPAFLGYQNFPAVLCTSVNDVIVHGVPSEEPLRQGDILGLDFGVIYKGWYSDTAVTVGVGRISPENYRLLRVTRKALRLGIKKTKPGNTVGDIGNTIQRFVEGQGFAVVKTLVGHGVGQELHEEPRVPNFLPAVRHGGQRGKGPKLEEGMVIAIEPMVVAAKNADLLQSRDGHGLRAKAQVPAAHFEHTVAITEKCAKILTEI